jgi:hypothetical protein
LSPERRFGNALLSNFKKFFGMAIIAKKWALATGKQ